MRSSFSTSMTASHFSTTKTKNQIILEKNQSKMKEMINTYSSFNFNLIELGRILILLIIAVVVVSIVIISIAIIVSIIAAIVVAIILLIVVALIVVVVVVVSWLIILLICCRRRRWSSKIWNKFARIGIQFE